MFVIFLPQECILNVLSLLVARYLHFALHCMTFGISPDTSLHVPYSLKVVSYLVAGLPQGPQLSGSGLLPGFEPRPQRFQIRVVPSFSSFTLPWPGDNRRQVGMLFVCPCS